MPQPQPNTGFGSDPSGGIDIGSLLQGLLANRGIDPSKIPGNGTQDSQPQLHPTAQAAQDGATKAIKELAYNATMQGGPDVAKHIVDTYATPPQTPAGDISLKIGAPKSNIDPTQLLSGLIAANMTGGQTSTAPAPASQPQLTPIQQQAQNIVSPQGIHPLGMLLNLIGNVSGMSAANQAINSVKLANLGEAQKVIAGQPAEVALPAAEAGLKQAELSAGTPAANVALTKQQIAQSKAEIGLRGKEIKAGYYKAQSERDIQNIQRLTDRRKQVLDQMNEDLQHGPIMNRGKRLDTYRKQLDYYDMELQKAGGNITQPPSSGYVKTGVLPDGRRVGKKADGTTEIING